ncbi:MAG TPA: hypothetical protein VFK37_07835 [Bacillales bacterium]|nr:hypothetical protein [Bacillales bacterium]
MIVVKEHLKESLVRWYKTMRKQEKEKAIQLKSELDHFIQQSKDRELQDTYKLLQIRFHLLLKNDTEVLKCFADVGTVRDLERDDLKYYYYFFNGIFLYENKHYEDAIESYLKAKHYLQSQNDPIESAEFQYKLSCAYHRARHFLQSLYEAKEALALFQKKGVWERCADCENVIAVNIMYLERNNQAEKHYWNALKWIEKVGDSRRRGIYYQNLGLFYSKQSLPESAINCLLKSIGYLDTASCGDEGVSHIYLLTKEYFRTRNHTDACRWLEEGLKRSREQNNEEYIHHFQLLEARYVQGNETFEEVYGMAINYFKRMHLWEPLMTCNKEMAQYYEKIQCYQEASHYYDLAFEAFDRMKKEGIR